MGQSHRQGSQEQAARAKHVELQGLEGTGGTTESPNQRGNQASALQEASEDNNMSLFLKSQCNP